MSYTLFSQEMIDFILDNYQNCTVEQLTHMMCGLFDYPFKVDQIKRKVQDLQIRKRNLKNNYGKYTPEMLEWLKTNYNTIKLDDLTKAFNQTFNTDYTKSALWHKINRIIEGGIVRDEHKMITRVKWTDEMIEWLKIHFEDDSYNRLAIKMNSIFNTKITGSSIEHKIARLGLMKSKDAIKRISLPNKYSFKKGCVPVTKKPIGYERITPEGYTWVKVAEPDIFRAKHRVIYEQHYGKIPPGHKVIFADGDKSNFNIDNLVLVSAGEHCVLNTQNLRFKGCGEATKSGLLIAKIMIRRGQLAKK